MTFKYMLILGVVVMLSFALQYFLGFKQIKHFNDEYIRLRKEGRVSIGRRAGKIQSGTIILFALDKNDRIRYGRKIQGTTILAKFKDFNTFNGREIGKITLKDEEMKKEIKITRKAVLDAVNSYNIVKNGEIIPEKKSPFGKVYEKLVH
ncbi:transcriptional regulator GutM [Clostridium estertheticum]|uniref:Transcriptional regulator n=1 Tax=Clostridium estertheticum TaxID=238834 RepID=A0A5N7IIF6_9CLOT|nr:transcriptional regulator GutM [Clostridium estertheticum]MBU3176990.1 transcriptional regulator GutM [Clostridium estertheticum]MBU3185730.1 transcriptional regulator GutM [Clostridium estertheticum]MCB2341805.1 transcriptional regulator GutM [Clostridium estertheticum]MPQ30074.1 transcriptional regulator [Clostridium estertheticum]MPQ60750.1 transcriptional regulator [Clostridium estertheticum]